MSSRRFARGAVVVAAGAALVGGGTAVAFAAAPTPPPTADGTESGEGAEDTGEPAVRGSIAVAEAGEAAEND